jgi:hypothetical protein
MSDQTSRQADLQHAEREMEEEAAKLTAGPGMVGTKSQTVGGGAGIVAGGAIGILIGLLVGFAFFDGATGVLASVAAFAFAGGTVGVLVGGFVPTRRKLEDSSTDADV